MKFKIEIEISVDDFGESLSEVKNGTVEDQASEIVNAISVMLEDYSNKPVEYWQQKIKIFKAKGK